jgi:ATP-dependent RNA helicase RhlE
MPPEISTLANSILNNPVRVEVTPVSSTVEKITQGIFTVDKKDKSALLIHLLKDSGIANVLVFTRTKHGADKLVKSLIRANISAEAIHGNKSQNARQKALSGFKSGDLRVLVATDIAARGIDVDDLKYVINFELPNQPETYVHRIGRTGRAGLSGTAWSFCETEEQPYLKDINKLTAQEIPVIEDHPYHLTLKSFNGTPAGKQQSNGSGRKQTPGKPSNTDRRKKVKSY